MKDYILLFFIISNHFNLVQEKDFSEKSIKIC